MRSRVVRVERDSLLEQSTGLGFRLKIPKGQGVAAQHAFVGRQICRRLAPGMFGARRLQASDKRPDDCADDLVLNDENLLLIAVKAVTPPIPTGRRIDELSGDAYPLADLAHATFNNELHAKFSCHPPRVDALAAVLEGRIYG